MNTFIPVKYVITQAGPTPASVITYSYDVIFWSVNLRNIITDKVDVGIFSRDAVFFYSEIGVTRWLLWYSDCK